MKSVVLLGSGGHALSVADAIDSCNELRLAGVLTEIDSEARRTPSGLTTLGTDADLAELLHVYDSFHVGVGYVRDCRRRELLLCALEELNARVACVVAGSAYVSASAALGYGVSVHHFAFVGPEARVSEGAIINTGAQIDHGARIGRLAHVSTGAIINGNATIGEQAMIGSGAVVLEGISVGKGVRIRAGSLVSRDTY